MSALTVALTLKAIDQASSVMRAFASTSVAELSRVQEKIQRVSQSLQSFGFGALADGALVAAALKKPLEAFADIEDAQARLNVTLLKNTGKVSQQAAEINALAVELGNKLPGTTADFANMFSTLISLGITEKDLLGGVGRAASHLAVVLRLPYEQAAEATAKLKEVTGVANKDMLEFMDTIQRTAFLGVQIGELKEAFVGAKVGLSAMKLQGLEASKEVAVLIATLLKGGITGQRAGSNLGLLLSTFADKAKLDKTNAALARYGITLDIMDRKTATFKGVRNLFQQFGQLDALNAFQRQEVLKPLFAAGVFELAEAAIIIEKGVKGFDEMNARMVEQASLQQRVTVLLGTLRNLWDATAGTFTNALASFAGALAPEIKFVTERLGDLSAGLDWFLRAHPILTKIVGLTLALFAALAIGAGAGALALAGVLRYVGFVARGIETLHRTLPIARGLLRNLIDTQVLSTIRQHGGLMQWLQFQLLRTQYATLHAKTATLAWAQTTWASARATVFNVGWLQAQAVTLGRTVWSATVSATRVTWAFVAAQWASLRATVASAGGLRALAFAAGGQLIGVLRAATVASIALSHALLFTPVGWIGLAVAAAAMLIYKFWSPIAGFFRGLWSGIREGLQSVAPFWQVFTVAARLVGVVLTPLRWLWQLITWLIRPFDDAGGAAEAFGVRVGRVIGRVIAFVATLPVMLPIYLAALPFKLIEAVTGVNLFAAGQKLVESLWRGITSYASKPIAAMMAIVTRIRNLLPFSPAKEGPLTQLHRVRLVETIADTIRPQVLLNRMRTVLTPLTQTIRPQGLLDRVHSAMQPPATPAAAAMPRLAMAGGGIGGIAVHITINGAETSGEGGAKGLAQRVAQETTLQIEKLLRRKFTI